MRFNVSPGDVPADVAARRLGLTPAVFNDRLPELLSRGFPSADPTTGNYDLDAIDAWRRLRHPRLFAVVGIPAARDIPKPNVAERIARLG